MRKPFLKAQCAPRPQALIDLMRENGINPAEGDKPLGKLNPRNF